MTESNIEERLRGERDAAREAMHEQACEIERLKAALREIVDSTGSNLARAALEGAMSGSTLEQADYWMERAIVRLRAAIVTQGKEIDRICEMSLTDKQEIERLKAALRGDDPDMEIERLRGLLIENNNEKYLITTASVERLREIERLKAALRFYSDRQTWVWDHTSEHGNAAGRDQGQRARAALERK